MALYLLGYSAFLKSLDPRTLYGFIGGFFLAAAMLFLYDRHIHRISGDPDHLRWWEAPAKDFMKSDEKPTEGRIIDCTPERRKERDYTKR